MKEEKETGSLLTLKELKSAVHGTVVALAENIKNFSFRSVVTDSRQVEEKSLFVPLIGEFQDGHIYIPQAIEKGASVIFVTQSVYEQNSRVYMNLVSTHHNVVFIVVENNLTALQDAARCYVKKFPKLIKISITGSSGKTTTKEICASILRQKYNLIATKGNLNSETGLPLSVFNIRPEHEAGLFEMGMNRENEIGEIARVFKPNYAIITNIGTAHIGLLGSRENIAKEKKKIFSYIRHNGIAVIHQKDDFADYLAKGVAGKVVYFGKDIPEEKSGVKFIEDLGIGGTKFAVDGIEAVLKIPGEYNYLNALSCIALAKGLGFTAQEIVDGINQLKVPEGRSHIKSILTKADSSGKQKKITLLEDCYNANPDSMERALEMCGNLKVNGRKIYILGDMFELGKDSVEAHSRVGAAAVVAKADMFVFIGQDMMHAANAAKMGGKLNIRYYKDMGEENFNELCTKLLDYLQDGDFVFVKASHGMHLEKVVEQISQEEICSE
ncbi:UDP-N-acetylmuramoyl-tripeptide--D-alanyl-D-alanine ligase [Treponema sp.]|uniref:UDP-N-acetylmuramoyl-tripeptide--D-alanyl-D- alanine ligase n=1 Tax=Treponema sp. TaxID=166 RepID=UPI00298E1C15|nr:UDP-N-acetylmuramoyl-tripeptide--D-alanyl-D-alanine ligase [Treponema sp.]MCR5613169.1 UDP-N-acetylmuramoyl-tripeptide--D-alanyl-D-alanine ligase [Treponema sp.]